MKFKTKSKFNRLFALLLGLSLILCALPVTTAFAEEGSSHGDSTIDYSDAAVKVTDGSTHKHIGDIKTTNDETAGIVAGDNSTVTQNGNISTTGKGSKGVDAQYNSKVTVNGNVHTSGNLLRNDAGYYYSSGVSSTDSSNVTINGNVTTDGDGDAIISSNSSEVTVNGNVNGYITNESNSKTTINGNVNGSVSSNWGTIKTHSIIFNESNSSAANLNCISNIANADGILIADGNVEANGKGSNAIDLAYRGKSLVKGNVSSKSGYGAIILCDDNKQHNEDDVVGPAILVVEGSLSGNKAPIAIIPPELYDDDGNLLQIYTNPDDIILPTIIVKNLIPGNNDNWIDIVKYQENASGDYDLVKIDAPALKDAILKNVYYIADGGQAIKVNIGSIQKTYFVSNSKTYKVIQGQDSIFTENKDGSLSFRANGDYNLFRNVKMDGTLIAPENYTAKEGSTIITFKKDYLNTLSSGKHTVTFVYADGGKCDANFEVKTVAAQPSKPISDSKAETNATSPKNNTQSANTSTVTNNYTKKMTTPISQISTKIEKPADDKIGVSTGDNTNIALWITFLVLACVSATIIIITNRKKD